MYWLCRQHDCYGYLTGYASAVSYLLLIVTVVVIQWSLNRLRRAS